MRHRPRAVLWATAGVATFGFLVALEITARWYGVPGPLTNQAREVVFAPHSGPLLYAGMALMMVVLTWRQRFVAAGAAVAVDFVFWVVRWAIDAPMNFGNGALWVILGCAVIAVTRRTGRDRALLLKGAGLGLLLIAGHKTGDTWLLITSKTRPAVLDPYLATADHALGNPSWVVGRLVEATGPIGTHVLGAVYGQLPLAAAIVALYQLRNVGVERRFPGHHLVRTFLAIGLLGPAIYMIFPVVGPVFAYGADGGHWAVANLWPATPVPVDVPHPIPFDAITLATACRACTPRGPPRSSCTPARAPGSCGTRARSGWSPRSARRWDSATTTEWISSPVWCSRSRSRWRCARSTVGGTGRAPGWSPTV